MCRINKFRCKIVLIEIFNPSPKANDQPEKQRHKEAVGVSERKRNGNRINYRGIVDLLHQIN